SAKRGRCSDRRRYIPKVTRSRRKSAGLLQAHEIKQGAIEQMAWPNRRERTDHRILASGHAPLDIVQHLFHEIALQAVLTAAKIAGNDREAERLGKPRKIFLGTEGEGAQHLDVALIIQQFWRHGRQPAAMEEIEKEGFKNVFPV